MEQAEAEDDTQGGAHDHEPGGQTVKEFGFHDGLLGWALEDEDDFTGADIGIFPGGTDIIFGVNCFGLRNSRNQFPTLIAEAVNISAHAIV